MYLFFFLKDLLEGPSMILWILLFQRLRKALILKDCIYKVSHHQYSRPSCTLDKWRACEQVFFPPLYTWARFNDVFSRVRRWFDSFLSKIPPIKLLQKVFFWSISVRTSQVFRPKRICKRPDLVQTKIQNRDIGVLFSSLRNIVNRFKSNESEIGD